MKDIILNAFEFVGMSMLKFMAWFWEDKEFDKTANEALDNMLK